MANLKPIRGMKMKMGCPELGEFPKRPKSEDRVIADSEIRKKAVDMFHGWFGKEYIPIRKSEFLSFTVHLIETIRAEYGERV